MPLQVEIDPGLRFGSPLLGELLVYWQNLRHGRLPSRADVDPLDMAPRLWPYLELVDILRQPDLRFRWRLIGTHVTEAVERDSTGRFFDELYAPEDLETLAMPFRWVVENRLPLRLFGTSAFVGKHWLRYEGVYLPLADDGESVVMVLGGVDYRRGNPEAKTPG